MRLIHFTYLIKAGGFESSPVWLAAKTDVDEALKETVWPPGSDCFTIHPEIGKKRGMGNGVVPIKGAFLNSLERKRWSIRDRRNPHRFDAVKYIERNTYIGLEWETGNISSSHRSVTRIFTSALFPGEDGLRLMGGMIILPTRNLAKYLTDRVGNYEELSDSFPVWEACGIVWEQGVLAVAGIEHEREDTMIPRIPKGTDGRALS